MMKVKIFLLLLFLFFSSVVIEAQDKPAGKTDSGLTDMSGAMPEENRFTVGGWMNFLAHKAYFEDKNSIIAKSSGDRMEFFLNNINLYFNFNVSKDLLAFAEVRFLFAPGTKTVTDSSYNTSYFNNDDTDANGMRSQYGTTYIERAYMEWKTYPFARIRVGRMITPFGIWSQDHGAPVTTTVRLPFVTSTQPSMGFPSTVTGLEALGSINLRNIVFSYAAYVGNNETDLESMGDKDSNKAYGGFTNFRIPFTSSITIDVGLSAYRGDTILLYNRSAAGVSTYYYNQTSTIGAGHVKLSVASLPLDGEFIIQTEAYIQRVNEKDVSRMSSFGPIVPITSHDYTRKVYYIQTEYRMFGILTPYFRFDRLINGDINNYLVNGLDDYNAGINIKPYPNLVLKFEFAYIKIDSADVIPYIAMAGGPKSPGNSSAKSWTISVSMSF